MQRDTEICCRTVRICCGQVQPVFARIARIAILRGIARRRAGDLACIWINLHPGRRRCRINCKAQRLAIRINHIIPGPDRPECRTIKACHNRHHRIRIPRRVRIVRTARIRRINHHRRIIGPGDGQTHKRCIRTALAIVHLIAKSNSFAFAPFQAVKCVTGVKRIAAVRIQR